MFRLISSHLQALKMKIQTYKRLLNCGIPNAYRQKMYAKGKVIPLQAGCGPEGG